MQIRTKGKSESISRKEAKEAANFFAEILLGKRLSNKISLLIHFDEKLDKEIKCKEKPPEGYVMVVGGYCTWIKNNHHPRRFKIQLCPKLEYSYQLEVLAHEMTHLKQFARGTLKQLKTYRKGLYSIRWKNSYYEDIKSAQDDTYHKQPWEIEAKKMESELVKRYVHRQAFENASK